MAGVYLVYHNRLFCDAVRAVLATHAEIRLLGASDRPDIAAAEMQALSPSVVLLEDADDGPALSAMHGILTSPTTYRLITLRMDHDGMHVWTGIWQQTACSQDLVEAIITPREVSV